jgi:hypothetical protein
MPIPKQDLLSIFFTFLVGFFGGVYLYLTGFAPFANELADIEISPTTRFEIVSEVYGGCREACPAYQVLSNGNYRYVYTPRAGAEQIIRQGTLPAGLQNNLKAALDEEAIVLQAEEVTPLVCNSYSDGIDIDYFITIGETEYLLSSCGTAVDADSELWLTLDSIWAYFESLGNNQ